MIPRLSLSPVRVWNYVESMSAASSPATMQLHRQMKMAAGLIRDIKRQVVNLSFDSAAEIAEEMSINVSQFISLLQLHVLTVLVNAH